MATVDQHMGHAGGDYRSGPGAGHRRHGRDTLAEVISIRTETPERSHRSGLIGSLVTMAGGFASPRVQAASVRSTPRRPSSPAPRPRPSAPQFPYDAA